MASSFLLSGGQVALAQAQPELRNINNQFKTEEGCPVQLLSAKTDLEIDPLGAPIGCRIYLDYKNISAKPIAAIKFRIGYVNAQEHVLGSFLGTQAEALGPGEQGKQKWRHGVYPTTSYVLIRVLAAKFGDGTLWESIKMKDSAPGTGGEGSAYGPDRAGAADTSSAGSGSTTDNSSTNGSSSAAQNAAGPTSESGTASGSQSSGSAAPANGSDGY